jgi:oligopeptide transport system substrate-binding protein
LPQESKTITPVIAATGTPTPSSIPTRKPGEFDTRPFVFLFLALTCLIGIVAIALLIILISRSARKKNIASVLIFFLLTTGIPFLSARGYDATPTPYPPVPTATAYVPMAVEEGTYADAVEGIFLKIPESVLLVPPEEDTGSMVDFNFSDYSIWGFLFPSQMDSSASLEENASDILKSSLTGLTDQQIVESKEKILPSGVHAWYSEVVAYNPSDNTNYQFGFLTVKGNINGLTLTTFSTPDYYSQYRYLVDELHDSLEIRPTSISGFSRDEVLILEGGETSNPRENDPATSHTGSDNLVFSGLVTYNTHMEVIPDLAENWEISPDRLTYTFRLNPTAVFHNGRPVTAEDVIFSWERAANPATDSDTVLTYLGDIVGIREMRAGKTGHVQGLAALDAHTLQVTIDEPKLYFLQKLTYPTTFIVDKENVALGEEWYRTPNGTGPYRLNRWESMTQKIYERFEDFYGEKPRIKGIIINLYSGDSTRLYESGSIDMTGIATYNIDRFKDPNEPMHQELYSTPNLCTSYITLDVTRPPFDDLKVRQAFAMAIDRELYIRVVHNNAAIPAHGLYPPALPGYDYSFTGLEFNPEKARQYLKESGYTPENIPEIIYSSAGYGSSISTADAAVIQMWEENLGIKVKVQNIEPEYYLENLIDDNTGQITQEGWCADYPDPENFADALYHTGAEMNTSGYSNPELDVLLEQARSELDTTSRILLYQQAERIIVEEVPAIFLSHSISFTLVKPYVQGYVEAPMAIPFERYLWIDPAKLPNP